jgi:hypothetical protein
MTPMEVPERPTACDPFLAHQIDFKKVLTNVFCSLSETNNDITSSWICCVSLEKIEHGTSCLDERNFFKSN